jgi:hypothetical protein
MHLHHRHKMRIMRLLAGKILRDNDALPCSNTAGVYERTLNNKRSSESSSAAACASKPKPLSAIERVATAQNSTKFCGAMQSVSLRNLRLAGQYTFDRWVKQSLRTRSQQDIRIDKNHALQSAVFVNGFPAHRFI